MSNKLVRDLIYDSSVHQWYSHYIVIGTDDNKRHTADLVRVPSVRQGNRRHTSLICKLHYEQGSNFTPSDLALKTLANALPPMVSEYNVAWRFTLVFWKII